MCAVEDCPRSTIARGWCSAHYQRWQKYGDPQGEAPPRRRHGPTCTIPGCGRRHSARGLCVGHWARRKKFGDPLADRPLRAQVGWGEYSISHGYAMLYLPDHPNANRTGRVAEHRVVMSKHLGRPLRPDEQVHHRNGNKLDNRVENLELRVGAHGNRIRVEDAVAYAVEILSTYAPEKLR